MTWYAALGALEQGLVYGIMAIGVYLTFRILDFPDLTVDGSLPLGASITALALTSGINPFVALLLSIIGGFLAGMVTAILNTKLKVLHLLASILTMIALYSINIRIMDGPNISLLAVDTVFDPLIALGIPGHLASTVVFVIFASIIVIGIVWFLYTELGLSILATGDNSQMITAQGVNTHTMIILGVGLSNALVALAGSLIAQNQGAADVNMGVGTIIAGLASVIVGETILGNKTIPRAIVAVLLGSVIYRLAIAVALGMELGDFSVSPSDLNLITAILVIIALTTPTIKKKLKTT
ncbi:MAG: ABC transporter permease [Proteobacteria bacterium]|nr:ABC transporter permease [Pseudomonadota bacterium]